MPKKPEDDTKGYSANIDKFDLNIAAILTHVIQEQRFLGVILISQLDRQPPRAHTKPFTIRTNNPKKALDVLTSHYKQNPNEIELPHDSALSEEQIVEVMGLLGQAVITRVNKPKF